MSDETLKLLWLLKNELSCVTKLCKDVLYFLIRSTIDWTLCSLNLEVRLLDDQILAADRL